MVGTGDDREADQDADRLHGFSNLEFLRRLMPDTPMLAGAAASARPRRLAPGGQAAGRSSLREVLCRSRLEVEGFCVAERLNLS